jgi:hypothetical protein
LAANLFKRAMLEQNKSEIMEFLSQALHNSKIMAAPNNPYVNSKVELRNINELWWRTKLD